MRPLLLSVLAASAPLLAQAQAACSSDGQSPPVALYERFISADCAACWAQAPAHLPGPSALVVDWIVPGPAGDDAPLSAAASMDAPARLQALQRQAPAGSDTHIDTVMPAGTRPAPAGGTAGLRVAHGQPFNDYLGASITFTHGALPSSSGPWHFYLLLVESVPAQSEGTPVPRQLVRNVFTGTWAQEHAAQERSRPGHAQAALQEMRPLRIPDGAQADRLRVVGWVQDAKGQVVAAAQSACR